MGKTRLSHDTPKPITHHLEELRFRILFSLIFVILASIGGYFFVDPVLTWLAKPVGRFIYTSPTDALFVRLKIAGGLGLLVSFPVLLYQIWRFIELGLLKKEKSIGGILLPVSCLLFYGGMALALFGVVPIAVEFLLQFGSGELQSFISIQAYLSFLLWMILGFGLFFQLPLLILALSVSGIVHPDQFSNYRKHVLVGLLILAAFITPGPDIFSQLILTLPSYLLFEISLWLSHRFVKKATTSQ